MTREQAFESVDDCSIYLGKHQSKTCLLVLDKSYVAFPAQLRCTMLIFLDSGLYSPRPSKPTPMKAAPSIMFCEE